MLNPAPDWVQSSRPKKKRRTSIDSSTSEASSNDGMDVDEDDLFAQPLARLLQDADSFTRRTDTSGSTKKKLRPEVIDIQRTKDIVTSGPVIPFFVQYTALAR
jgi:U3 small nucleolar RNA-associated protein 18